MSDISQAIVQDEIASSLMDAPIVGSWADGSLAESGVDVESAQIEPGLEQERTDGSLSDQERDDLARSVSKPGESFQKEGAQKAQPSAEQQSQPLTAEQIQEGIVALDGVIEQHQLNDPASANEFANEFCGAFGLDVYSSGVDVKGLGNVMAKTAFSALTAYDASGGDPSKLAPIPPASAQAFSREFLRAWGVDPRETAVDEQLLANTVFAGAMNFLDSYQKYGGKVSDMDQLNSPEAAEFFLGNFLKAFGLETQVDRTMALKFADAAGKYLLGFMAKVNQMQPQAQPSERRAGSGRRAQSSARRSSRFQSNADIFDEETLEQIQREKMARSQDAEEFRPKQRASRSPFATNSDLFDGPTMDAWYRDNGRL